MAKKGAKEFTPEERLEQALVPETEWPYELPDGWKWVFLGKITDVVGGGTPSTSHPEYYEGGNIPWLSPADLSDYSDIYISKGNKNITKAGLENSSTRLLPKGTVCLSSRAPIGYVVIAANELCTNQGFKSFTPSPYIYPEFLYWYLKCNKSMLESMASGTTFLELSGKRTAQVKMPLPPVSLQKSIATFIGKEFQRLNEAKERVQAVLEDSEARKQSILYKAFTGELTKEWRKKCGRSIETWKKMTLQDVCAIKITDGTHQTPTYMTSGKGVPFLSSKDVTSETICWDNIKYITKDLHEELYARISPQRDDVLLAKNGTTGVAAKVDTDRIFDIYVTLAVLRPNKNIILPDYLLRVVNSPLCKNQFSSHLTGIGVSNLHLRDIKEVLIFVPEMDEQEEIVKVINHVIADDKAALDIAAQVNDNIDDLKQSLLSKAFHGELSL